MFLLPSHAISPLYDIGAVVVPCNTCITGKGHGDAIDVVHAIAIDNTIRMLAIQDRFIFPIALDYFFRWLLNPKPLIISSCHLHANPLRFTRMSSVDFAELFISTG